MHSKQRNPTWTRPDGKKIPWEDKANNELGDAWIAIVNAQYPKAAGYGLHGTNKPNTIGTRCSRGCIRLRNDHAVELLQWVRRKDSNGGCADSCVHPSVARVQRDRYRAVLAVPASF